MVETNKGISLIMSILGIIVLMIIGLFVYQEFFSTKGEADNVNFSEIGNLIINNPGFEENAWYLSYEISGVSANSVKLSFDEDSICRNETNSCSDLTSGERVEVRGLENNGMVVVREIDFK